MQYILEQQWKHEAVNGRPLMLLRITNSSTMNRLLNSHQYLNSYYVNTLLLY